MQAGPCVAAIRRLSTAVPTRHRRPVDRHGDSARHPPAPPLHPAPRPCAPRCTRVRALCANKWPKQRTLFYCAHKQFRLSSLKPFRECFILAADVFLRRCYAEFGSISTRCTGRTCIGYMPATGASPPCFVVVNVQSSELHSCTQQRHATCRLFVHRLHWTERYRLTVLKTCRQIEPPYILLTPLEIGQAVQGRIFARDF